MNSSAALNLSRRHRPANTPDLRAMELPDMAALTKDLHAATTRVQDAKAAVREADREETAALNALNEAQKAFDAAAAVLRNAAPEQSDWHRKSLPGVCVGVSADA